MNTMRGNHLRWVRLAVLCAVALVTPAAPAGAEHDTYSVPERKLGYSACGWAAGRAVTVAVDPAFPFPDAAYEQRIDEAIRRWEGVLTSSRARVGMVRATAGRADVTLQYRPTEGSGSEDVLGETYLRRESDADLSPNIGRCPDRRPISHRMAAAEIRINPRDDWFAGPDDEVSRWQMCANAGFRATNSGYCADQVDFASTLIHELGHALVFYHPQTLDDIDGVPIERSDSASRAARCVEATGDFEDQATLCAGQGIWRAEQRTLETWDIETAHRHYR